MKISIRHQLTLDVGTPPRVVAHLLLTPLATVQQKIVQWTIDMPGIDTAAAFRDGFGNKAHLVSVAKPDGPIEIVVTGVVETTDKAGVLGRLDLDPVPALFRRPENGVTADPALLQGLSDADGKIGLLHQLMDRIHGPSQSQAASGQSQSQAATGDAAEDVRAFIAAARSLDIPARYVTGYLADGSADAGLHRWAEAWDERLGWIGFDPLLKLCPADRHVRLASAQGLVWTTPIRTVPAPLVEPTEAVIVEAS